MAAAPPRPGDRPARSFAPPSGARGLAAPSRPGAPGLERAVARRGPGRSRAPAGPRLAVAVALALAALAVAAPRAAAAPPPQRPAAAPPAERPAVEFRWDAPAGCPGEDEVRAQLEALLGGPLAERRGERLTAIARVRQEPGGRWDLRLWTVSDAGTLQRSLGHERCDMLARAGVLIAAMTIDPLASERLAGDEEGDGDAVSEVAAGAEEVAEPEPIPEPEPEPEPAPTIPVSPTPAQEPAKGPAAPPRRPDGALRLAGGLAFGDLPGVGAALRLTGALLWPQLRLEVDAVYHPVRRARFDDAPDIGVDLQLAGGAARACPRLRPRPRVEVPICGGVELGAMYGRGVGYEIERDAVLFWAALTLAPAIVVTPHPRVGLWAAVEGEIALARPRFVAGADDQPIYRARAGGVRGLIGVEVRFGAATFGRGGHQP